MEETNVEKFAKKQFDLLKSNEKGAIRPCVHPMCVKYKVCHIMNASDSGREYNCNIDCYNPDFFNKKEK
jgi:hypothetical protein